MSDISFSCFNENFLPTPQKGIKNKKDRSFILFFLQKILVLKINFISFLSLSSVSTVEKTETMLMLDLFAESREIAFGTASTPKLIGFVTTSSSFFPI
jgi:hypothetical protein